MAHVQAIRQLDLLETLLNRVSLGAYVRGGGARSILAKTETAAEQHCNRHCSYRPHICETSHFRLHFSLFDVLDADNLPRVSVPGMVGAILLAQDRSTPPVGEYTQRDQELEAGY